MTTDADRGVESAVDSIASAESALRDVFIVGNEWGSREYGSEYTTLMLDVYAQLLAIRLKIKQFKG
jgi:hypothetical protein